MSKNARFRSLPQKLSAVISRRATSSLFAVLNLSCSPESGWSGHYFIGRARPFMDLKNFFSNDHFPFFVQCKLATSASRASKLRGIASVPPPRHQHRGAFIIIINLNIMWRVPYCPTCLTYIRSWSRDVFLYSRNKRCLAGLIISGGDQFFLKISVSKFSLKWGPIFSGPFSQWQTIVSHSISDCYSYVRSYKLDLARSIVASCLCAFTEASAPEVLSFQAVIAFPMFL